MDLNLALFRLGKHSCYWSYNFKGFLRHNILKNVLQSGSSCQTTNLCMFSDPTLPNPKLRQCLGIFGTFRSFWDMILELRPMPLNAGTYSSLLNAHTKGFFLSSFL